MNQKKLARLCNVSEVPQNCGIQIELPGHEEPYAVFNAGGEFYLTDDTCTHAMASLAGGDVYEGTIICPLHGGAFDLKTGKATEAPCEVDLKTYEIVRQGDELFAKFD